MHKIIFFPEKKIKYVCLPYPKFSDPSPETHLFFVWPNTVLLYYFGTSRELFLTEMPLCDCKKRSMPLCSHFPISFSPSFVYDSDTPHPFTTDLRPYTYCG